MLLLDSLTSSQVFSIGFLGSVLHDTLRSYFTELLTAMAYLGHATSVAAGRLGEFIGAVWQI